MKRVIINADVVDANPRFARKKMNDLVDEFYSLQDSQDAVEEKVAGLNKKLVDFIYSRKYKLDVMPVSIRLTRSDLPMLTRLTTYLPPEWEPIEDWDEEDLNNVECIYPVINQMIRDLITVQEMGQEIRQVARTAPAGERYAYDKCKGNRRANLGDASRIIEQLRHAKAELDNR